MRRTFSFQSYDPTKISPPPVGDLLRAELPIEMLDCKDGIIRQADFDPTEKHLIGLLGQAWGSHRTGSIVVAPDINFMPGSRFAVSTESVYE
jgi:hypothetical protein